MKSLQVIASAVLCGLVLCASIGRSSAVAVSSPYTVAQASGLGVYLYNPASRTIACPLDYSNEIIMIPWQDYNISMMWTVTEDPSNPVYYVSAQTASAAGCPSGTTAYWAGVQGATLSTECSATESGATSFTFGNGAKTGNLIIYANSASGNSIGNCITIVGGIPTLPALACSLTIAATQWQLVTIG